MAQFARPDADVSLGGWSNPSWSTIDEVTASDVDKTVSPTAPANATLVVGLSDVEDPQVGTGHIIRYRYQKSAAGGAQIDLTVRLLELAVERKVWTHTNIANGWADAAQTLLAAEADAIGVYADLRLEFKANQV